MKINLTNLSYFIKNIQNPESVTDKSRVESDTPNSQKANSQNIYNQSNSALPGSFHINALNTAQQAVLIRELLNLPKEFKEFLSLMVYGEVSQENLLKLLQDKSKDIQLKDIQNLLDTNSKEVISKLLKLLQPGSSGFKDTEQLNKLVNLLTQTISSQNNSPQEILNKTILLYLPWLPLVQQQDIDIKLEERKGSENDQENIALIMYISTINLGRFKITLILNADSSLNIDIESEEAEKNKIYLEKILSNVNQEMSKNKINGKTNVYTQKFKTEKDSDKRELSLCPVSNISPKIMMAAYSIAKIIFEIDENVSLIESRKQRI
ncbi:MAG: hypothetical protein A2287_05510 [Candidatus Melainabacteria bacterium RIFOXYA12_FULL_32_12]|nr:MAG: hypothetical protein A2255_04165 [Candidatus Melainabacteria bacterium RIFOXYA2_FULL_32_9]OGI30982.1 MAG: hypothetical protein A2287_05510 [Candidatus Melainabacteria bacterium RIFOXYA12_FULL_32_12]